MPATVSLVIVAHNDDAHLAAAIGSTLRQTFGDFELLVWDDGSTDRTLEVARKAAGGDPRVRLRSGDHRGFAASLNAAAREVHGRYFAWIEADDALAPTAVERALAVLEARPDLGMVYTQYVTMDETGQIGGLGDACAIPYSKERLLVDFMTFQFRLVRRAVFDAVGGLDELLAHAQDYDFCLKLSEVASVEHLAEPLYFHRTYDRVPPTHERVSQIHADRDVIGRALARRGLAPSFDVDVEIVGRFELRRKSSVSPHSDRPRITQTADGTTPVFTPDWTLMPTSAPAADFDAGMVSCLCVTRGRGDRLRRALGCFRAQTYRNREIVVVYEELDEKARDLLVRHPEGVSLVSAPITPKKPLGALRNLSLAAARGAFVCCWDDDDWYSPRRIELELGQLLRSGADACVLSRWLMVDETTRQAYASSRRLWEGSLLSRRELSALREGYPPLPRDEDTVLLERLRAQHRLVTLEQPELYVYIHHGGNTWGREHFLRLTASASPLSPSDADRLIQLALPELESAPSLERSRRPSAIAGPQDEAALQTFCAARAGERAPVTLVVAAHPDDETIGAGARIAAIGEQCWILHLTDGVPADRRFFPAAARDLSPEQYGGARREEAPRALALAGIEPSRVLRLGLRDQEAAFDLQVAAERIVALISELNPDVVLTHPYEGGHPDHDAAAFAVHVAVDMVSARGRPPPAIVEMTSYHARGAETVRGEFLPHPAQPEVFTIYLGDDERTRKRAMLAAYATQGELLTRFPLDCERFRLAPPYDFREPPHEGLLHYERFGSAIEGAMWRGLARASLKKLQRTGPW